MAEIYIIMGKSASGKDTVFGRLKEDSSLGLKTVTMYTTRPMREGERDGREYFFTDEERAREYGLAGKIIELREYNTVHGIWKYFTADDGQIDIEGNEKYLIIGTLEVYKKFAAYYGKEHMIPIYIKVDEGTRIRRALEREERQAFPDYAEMCRRYLADETDFSLEKLAEAGISRGYVNNSLEECVDKISSDIRSGMH